MEVQGCFFGIGRYSAVASGHPFAGSRLTEIQHRLSAALAGRYVLERELGRGGMATVYLARDLKHERAVALKVPHPELAATLGPERFLQEIRTTARLQHPHILPVLDSGEAAGLLWYTPKLAAHPFAVRRPPPNSAAARWPKPGP